MPTTSERRPGVSEETLGFAGLAAWLRWLEENHASSPGLWVKLAKKGTAALAYPEAVEGALVWGWIDGQKQALDARFWLQRFTPRRPQSPWSKINRDKAQALAAGRMAAPGLAEVERAMRDGRWDAAYDSARTAQVPDDLARALAAAPEAAAFFAALDGANRYAVLYRVQTAKTPEARARRVAQLVAMLARRERSTSGRRAAGEGKGRHDGGADERLLKSTGQRAALALPCAADAVFRRLVHMMPCVRIFPTESPSTFTRALMAAMTRVSGVTSCAPWPGASTTATFQKATGTATP